MTEQEKLNLALKGWGAEVINVTLGDEPASAEETARQIRKSLIAVKRGEARDVDLTI